MTKKNTVIVVAYPDRDEGNDPEPFFFFFFFFTGVGSLSQSRLNIFTVGNMRVMICLGQGGLRSLSASSLDVQIFTLFVLTINHIHFQSLVYVTKIKYSPRFNQNANAFHFYHLESMFNIMCIQ